MESPILLLVAMQQQPHSLAHSWKHFYVPLPSNNNPLPEYVTIS
jgi:hypothetical protein